MYVKDKKLLDRGFGILRQKLGEERTATFLSLVMENDMNYEALVKLSEELEEERKAKEAKKAEELAAQAPVIRALSESEYNQALDEYKEFLERNSIKYGDRQEFYVFMPSKDETKDVFIIKFRHDISTKGITLDVYTGRVLTNKVRPVNSFFKLLEKEFPEYEVYTETYHKYSHEFSLIRTIDYKGTESLHEEVEKHTRAADRVRELAIAKFGDDFEA